MDMKKKTQDEVIKQFSLSNFSLKNRITVVLIFILLVVLGVGAYNNLPKESYPEVEQSTVFVGTPYPGNSPTDIENLITRPIEKEINTISEIKEIRSNSIQGFSTIVAEFVSGTDIEYAKSKVKDAVDKSKINLPTDLPRESEVYEISFSDFPVMSVTLSGEYTIDKLESYGEILKDELEKISDISKVNIAGVEEKEIAIMVNPFELEARSLSFSDIENAVKFENISVSGGNLLENDMRRSVRLIGEFKQIEDIESIIISNRNDKVVFLKDVADIRFGYKEIESYMRLSGKPVVSVDVSKRSGTNLLLLNDKVNSAIDEIKGLIPKDIDVIIVNNQSQNTKEQVSTLENSIFSGVILVVLVLMFFLGVRNALFVGLSIPLSMCISFIILQLFGITVNMMILFSLVISLGLLVDNGIVVTENIYRFLEKGYSKIEATKLGIGEIALPIITSTATTLAVFVPLAFWPGLTGQFMSYLPIGIIVTLLSSLFVALVINPVMISYLMKIEDNKGKDFKKYIKNVIISALIGFVFILFKIYWIGNILIFISLFILSNYYVFVPLSKVFREIYLKRLENRYSKFLSYLFLGNRPYFVLVSSFLLLIGTFQLLQIYPPKVLFFPENRPNYINVFLELPVGTDIEETNNFAKIIEDEVNQSTSEYSGIIESIVTYVGQRTLNENDPSALGMRDTPNRARININFYEFEKRNGINTIDVLEKLRNDINEYPGVSITYGKDRKGPPVGGEISIQVTGPDFQELISQVENMRKYINESNIPGIEKLGLDLSTRKPELLIDFDRDRLRRYGLSTGMLANELRTSLFGKEISKYKVGEDEYKIQLRLADEYRYDINTLLNKNITFRNQSNGRTYQVPISSFASMKMSNTFSSVKRKDLDKVITVSSNVISGYNPTQVNSKIDMVLKNYPLPNGYSYKFGGEQQEQEEEMAFLSNAFMIALFLVFIIIVAQFNKIITPLIIMSSIILSTIGVFLGLLIFNMDFVVVMTMIGVISLIGIVVNNAIVLIDFIELNRKRKMIGKKVQLSLEEVMECVAEAGRTRLRPVILTALTTILGLMPLAIGMNFDFVSFFKFYEVNFYLGGDNMVFFGPIAWAIIFGLSFATFLTLLVIPSMYLIQVKLNRYLGLS
ncbi:MAG: copper transporter [Cytophagia bacterium]|nr:copper transporter [Cytophagia bacterium]